MAKNESGTFRPTVLRVVLRHEDGVVAAVCLDCRYSSHGDDVTQARDSVLRGIRRMIQRLLREGGIEEFFNTEPDPDLVREFNQAISQRRVALELLTIPELGDQKNDFRAWLTAGVGCAFAEDEVTAPWCSPALNH